MQRTVGTAKLSAEHDNRTVYMEKVPPDSSLIAVNAVSMVKPAALTEYTHYNGNNHGGGSMGSNGQGGHAATAAAVVFFKVPTPFFSYSYTSSNNLLK